MGLPFFATYDATFNNANYEMTFSISAANTDANACVRADSDSACGSPSPSPSPSPSSDSDDGLSGGAIAGIIIGSIVFLVAASGLGYFCYKKS